MRRFLWPTLCIHDRPLENYPRVVREAMRSFLEPFCGQLLPEVDKIFTDGLFIEVRSVLRGLRGSRRCNATSLLRRCSAPSSAQYASPYSTPSSSHYPYLNDRDVLVGLVWGFGVGVQGFHVSCFVCRVSCFVLGTRVSGFDSRISSLEF